jgi:hypothetical protein
VHFGQVDADAEKVSVGDGKLPACPLARSHCFFVRVSAGRAVLVFTFLECMRTYLPARACLRYTLKHTSNDCASVIHSLRL